MSLLPGVRSAVRGVLRYLKEQQFDVVLCGSSSSYNASIASKQLTRLPENKLVLCVGNSSAMWPRARALLEAGEANPFDRLSESAAAHCSSLLATAGVRSAPFLSHKRDPFLVSFQPLAVGCGGGVFHPGTHLLLHPRFGPWAALRFAVVLDADAEEGGEG
ncbi:hypothetical protein B484DRAFT_425444, partial [Ochromonadaceae sp. CCMP2298]